MIHSICAALAAAVLVLSVSADALAGNGEPADSHSAHKGHDAQSSHSNHGAHSGHAGKEGGGDHSGHAVGSGEGKIYMYQGSAAPKSDYVRERAAYDVPAVVMRDQTGAEVRLDEFLGRDRPVALQFIFTSCATICPVLSASFAQTQDDLAAMAPDVALVSVSIDPEYDTPRRLAAYAERFGAGENWTFLTGKEGDVRTLLRTFDAVLVSGNKMYHRPYTYLRAGAGAPWLRLNALVGGADLKREFRQVLDDGAAAGAGAQ